MTNPEVVLSDIASHKVSKLAIAMYTLIGWHPRHSPPSILIPTLEATWSYFAEPPPTHARLLLSPSPEWTVPPYNEVDVCCTS